jgi:hypothetical protein
MDDCLGSDCQIFIYGTIVKYLPGENMTLNGEACIRGLLPSRSAGRRNL